MHVICLSGAPATGKSTLLKRFSRSYKTISFDDIMMAYFHTSDVIQALDDYQEDYLIKCRAIDFFIGIVTHYAYKNGIVLVEGVFGDPIFRSILLSKLSIDNIYCSFVWLTADKKVCAFRNSIREAHIDSRSVDSLISNIIPPMYDEGFSTLFTIDTTNADGFLKATAIITYLVGLHTDVFSSQENLLEDKIALWLTCGDNLPSLLRWEDMDPSTKEQWRKYLNACLMYKDTKCIPISPDEYKDSKISAILKSI